MGCKKVIVIEKTSSTNSTKWVHTIYNDNPSPTTYASFILLRDQFRKLDADYIEAKGERMKRIEFSRQYLTRRKKELGSLTCEYCNKPNLVIEYEGMKVPSKVKATCDHVVPISGGGAIYDEGNIKIACEPCNRRKGDKTNWMPTQKHVRKLANFEDYFPSGKQLKKIISPYYGKCQSLECDGMTRVIHYLLNEKKIPHDVYAGQMMLGKEEIPVHFWIALPDGRIIDYKARMWLTNKDAPHGIFHSSKTKAKYVGMKINLPVDKFIFEVLLLSAGMNARIKSYDENK